MGKNRVDRRCSSVWDSFIATQALQCIMQIKNYKGGEISKEKKKKKPLTDEKNDSR